MRRILSVMSVMLFVSLAPSVVGAQDMQTPEEIWCGGSPRRRNRKSHFRQS